jgi:hypothetical protein
MTKTAGRPGREIGAGTLLARAGTDRHRIPYRLAGGLSGVGVVLILAMLVGLTGACGTPDAPDPHASDEPAPRLPPARVLDAVRRAPGIRTLPNDLTPAPAAAPQDRGFDSDKCEAGPSAARIDPCVFGDPAGSTRVVLVGDSHAGMWLPPLIEIARRRHWQLRFFGKPACPVPDLTFWDQQRERPFTECDRFRTYAESQVFAARPDLVLVTSDSYGQKSGPEQAVTATAWQDGLTRTLGTLRRSGARVIVIGDTPVLARSGPECLAGHPRNIVTCFTTRARATERIWNDADEAAARATGSGYVPALPWLCSAVCTPVVGNVLVYRNRFMLTATYSRSLNGVLETAVVRQVARPARPDQRRRCRRTRIATPVARPVAAVVNAATGTAAQIRAVISAVVWRTCGPAASAASLDLGSSTSGRVVVPMLMSCAPSDRVLHRLDVAAAAGHRLERLRRHRALHLRPPDHRGHPGGRQDRGGRDERGGPRRQRQGQERPDGEDQCGDAVEREHPGPAEQARARSGPLGLGGHLAGGQIELVADQGAYVGGEPLDQFGLTCHTGRNTRPGWGHTYCPTWLTSANGLSSHQVAWMMKLLPVLLK